MGKVVERFKLWNIADERGIREGTVLALEEECLVDTGATTAVVPLRIVQALRLTRDYTRMFVTFADGHREQRDLVIDLRVGWGDRTSTCRAIIEPGRDTVLIGQVVLEDLDVLVDPKGRRLVPRHAEGAEFEVLGCGKAAGWERDRLRR